MERPPDELGDASVGEGLDEAGPEPPITADGEQIDSPEDWVYDLKPTGLIVQEVQDKVLGLTRHTDTSLTRRYIKPTITPGGPSGETVVEIDIHHQRRRNKGTSYAPLNLSHLRGGWWTHVPLNSAETLRLYQHLDNLYAIGATGISRTRRTLRVVDADEVTVAGDLGEIVSRLRADHGDVELSRYLGDLAPDLVATMALKLEHARRLEALAEFELHMRPRTPDLTWSEPAWKAYFKRNEWIFGHNLDYQFLADEMPEAYVGGRRPSGGGSQLADHVMGTGGDWSFAVLVEIKRPDTALLGGHYREGTYRIGADLSDAVAQAQANCQALIRMSSTTDASRELDALEMSVADPRGIVLVGDTVQLTDPPRRETFQRFRHNLWNPTVMTYDELLNRARFQVARTTPSDAPAPTRVRASRSVSLEAAPTPRPGAPVAEEPFIIVGGVSPRDSGPEWGPVGEVEFEDDL